MTNLLASVEHYGPTRRQTRIESEPSLSAEAALEEQKWAALTTDKIKRKIQRNTLTRGDQELYRGIVASAILDYEPALRREMFEMMEEGEVDNSS